MAPTFEQIRDTAYDRWERRGWAHGHDREDWLAAERQQRFASNYRVVAAFRGDASASIGGTGRRRCRFCGQAEPRSRFPSALAVLPAPITGDSPRSYDQCVECAESFTDGIDADLAEFLVEEASGARRDIPMAAFKGLVKLALAIMPAADLEELESAIEWVVNPDHDLDFNVFRGLSCAVHEAARPFPSPWAALARKQDDHEHWPTDLLFLGVGGSVFQVPVPLNPRDEDLDITGEIMPEVQPPSPFGIEYDPISWHSRAIAPTSRGQAGVLVGAGAAKDRD